MGSTHKSPQLCASGRVCTDVVGGLLLQRCKQELAFTNWLWFFMEFFFFVPLLWKMLLTQNGTVKAMALAFMDQFVARNVHSSLILISCPCTYSFVLFFLEPQGKTCAPCTSTRVHFHACLWAQLFVEVSKPPQVCRKFCQIFNSVGSSDKHCRRVPSCTGCANFAIWAFVLLYSFYSALFV